MFFLYEATEVQAVKPQAVGQVKIDGHSLLVDGKAFIIKGVCWSPAGIGTKGERRDRIEEFHRWYRRDIELIARMNANVVYTFLDFGGDVRAIEILDFLHKHRIKAVVTVDFDGTNDLQRIREIVPKYKDHPAILMWAIGNEWNINLYHRKFSSLLDAAKATETAARLIKSLDRNHPVASIFGEIVIPGAEISTAEIVNRWTPSVEVWGLNIYRGDNFGDLFDHWKRISSKPMFISEFGTDSFRSDSWWPVKGREDLEMQRAFVGSLWRHLSANLSACEPENGALGGTVFEWVDEWWKVLPQNGGGEFSQDANGFPTPWNKYSHPDSFGNEEHFGLVRIDRSVKPLYEELQRLFSLDPCPRSASPSGRKPRGLRRHSRFPDA